MPFLLPEKRVIQPQQYVGISKYLRPNQTFLMLPSVSDGTRISRQGRVLHTADKAFYTNQAPKTSEKKLTIVFAGGQTAACGTGNLRYFEIGGYSVGGGIGIEQVSGQESVTGWTGTWNTVGDCNFLDSDVGVDHFYVAVLNDSSLKLFRDGVKVYDGSITWNAPDTGKLTLGASSWQSGTSERCSNFQYSLFAADFGNAIPDAIALSLSANPWQIFAADDVSLIFDYVSSGGSVYDSFTTLSSSNGVFSSTSASLHSSATVTTLLNVENNNTSSIEVTSQLINSTAINSAAANLSTSNINVAVSTGIADSTSVSVSPDTIFNIVPSILNTTSLIMEGSSSIGTIKGITSTTNNNIESAINTDHQFSLSSISELIAVGSIQVDCMLASTNGLLTSSTLILNQQIILNTAPSILNTTSLILDSITSFDLIESISSTVGNLLYDDILLNTSSNLSSSYNLIISGNISLSSNNDITSIVNAVLEERSTLSVRLLESVISSALLNTGISLDSEVRILTNGVNPAVIIRIGSREILFTIQDKDLLFTKSDKDVLFTTNK